MLHEAREVAEAEVDDLDSLALDEAQDLRRRALLHRRVPFPHGDPLSCAVRL